MAEEVDAGTRSRTLVKGRGKRGKGEGDDDTSEEKGEKVQKDVACFACLPDEGR